MAAVRRATGDAIAQKTKNNQRGFDDEGVTKKEYVASFSENNLMYYNVFMNRLFTIDLKDYDMNWEKFYRPSVRAIIFDKKGRLAMVYSRKRNFYKFPGGGIEENETKLKALKREVREETGLMLIPDSVKEFGEVLKIQKAERRNKNIIHVQYNYYYICKIEDAMTTQNLDKKEKELDFVVKFVSPDEAIRTNALFDSEDEVEKQMIEREKRVLEIVRDESLMV